MPFIIVAFLLAAAIGGGTSLAAQHALPGDPLWIFKTEINEKAGEMLAQEGTARAELHIAAVEGRINETVLLATAKPLPPDIKMQIEKNIALHARGAEAQISQLQNNGEFHAAAAAATRLQSALAKQTGGVLELGALLDEASALSADADAKMKP